MPIKPVENSDQHVSGTSVPIYDPRVQFSTDEEKKSAQVIWSTKSIELALDAIKQGLPLRSNPFLENKIEIRKPNLTFQLTPHETKEFLKCKMDILYFANTYCCLKTNKGFRPIKLRPYQRRLLKSFHKNKFNITLMPRQMGKCFTFDTIIKVRKDGKIWDTTFGKLYYDILSNKRSLTIEEHTFIDAWGVYIDTKNEAPDIAFESLKCISGATISQGHEKFDLSDKIVQTLKIEGYEVWTDTGFEDLTELHQTRDYEIYQLETISGLKLNCADNHIIFDENGKETYVKSIKTGFRILAQSGIDTISKVTRTGLRVKMYDCTVKSEHHRLYTNEILSHNTTTTAIFLAHYTLFNYDKTIAVLGQKAKTGKEIILKVKQILAALPFFLKPGVNVWNDGNYLFDNGCRAVTAATTVDSIQGFTIDALYVDEFAYIHKNMEKPFYDNIYPTVSNNPDGKLIISSTPNGKNLFHKLWSNATKGLNEYVPVRVNWWEHPDRDEKWKAIEIANTDEETFAQQYDCSFDTAVKALLKTHTVKYLKWTNKKFIKDLYTMGTDYDDGFSYTDVFKYNFKQDYFIISVDVSEGLGKDASTIKIFRVNQTKDGKIRLISVAKFQHFKIEIEEFAKVICKMMTHFDQEKTRLIIERNNFGDQLIIQMENFANNDDSGVEYDIELETFAKFRRSADNPKLEKGLRLNIAYKRIGVAGFKSYMDDKIIIDIDTTTCEEIFDFGEDDKGKFRAAGGHDDLVMPIVNMAYYIKSNNYGWLDMVEEYKDIDDKEIKDRDTINENILNELGIWFENQMNTLTAGRDSEDVTGFDYANFDKNQIKGIITSGIVVIGKEEIRNDLSEYDFDEEAMSESTEYDGLFDPDDYTKLKYYRNNDNTMQDLF